MAQTPDLSRHEIESEFAVRNAPPASLYEVRRMIASAIANPLIRPTSAFKERIDCTTDLLSTIVTLRHLEALPREVPRPNSWFNTTSFANHSFAHVTPTLSTEIGAFQKLNAVAGGRSRDSTFWFPVMTSSKSLSV